MAAKLDKFRMMSQESRRSLRDQINSFNMEGEEMKKNKETIILLQKERDNLKAENLYLRENLESLNT